ncbi:MAG: hypothetical protein R3D30_00250 [Hyphomicrobiales bacterium]
MSDPLKIAYDSKPMAARIVTAAAAVALSFGLFSASAHAGPAQAVDGLKSPGLDLQTVGYKKKYKRLSNGQTYPQNYYPSNPDYAQQPYMPYGGSDEILELQRRFPQTNWPQSMRYFPNTP